MIGFFFRGIKGILIVLAILAAGQWIQWDSATLSEHFGTWLKKAQITHRVTQWTTKGKAQLNQWVESDPEPEALPKLKDSVSTQQAHEEQIAPSEQQRLKKLIQQLNQ